MNNIKADHIQTSGKKGFGCLKVLVLMVLTVIVSVALTLWIVSYYFFPKPFEPVELNSSERKELKEKLQVVGLSDLNVSAQSEEKRGDSTGADVQFNDAGNLTPTPYSEVGASREIHLTEKELNALLASNTDMGEQLVIDLSDKLASASLLVSIDPDFPFLGGKTLRAKAGLGVDFANNKPVLVLKGVSVWGVPIPNEWLGGYKNVDLVNGAGNEGGLLHGFAEGIEDIRVEEGSLYIKLNE